MALTLHDPQAASAKNINRARQSFCLVCRSTEATENRGERVGRGSLTWQLGGRNVLPILVGQLPEAPQAAAVAQHGAARDPVIWKSTASWGHGQMSEHPCPERWHICGHANQWGTNTLTHRRGDSELEVWEIRTKPTQMPIYSLTAKQVH